MKQDFLKALFTLLVQYFPEQVDQSLKPIDSANSVQCKHQVYDFIIVGAGSAGCVLANRLSENLDWKVLLIEAGDDENYQTDVPALFSTLSGSKFDWNYTTVIQRKACANDRCSYPRGHVMGGSSTINGMAYDRGSSMDYDEWEMMGNPGWGYKDVKQYFLRTENMTVPELMYSPYHSTKGPLSVGYSIYRPQITRDLIDAAVEYGLKIVDYNGNERIGVNYAQYTLSGPTRCSTSKAYLNPIKNRKNLFIFKNTKVTKVLIDEKTKTTIGVRCTTNNGPLYDIYASKEVILSAGAINTPQILMLSGIGPADHLAEHDIPILVNNQAVGNYLADNNFIPVTFKIDNSILNCCNVLTNESALEYARDKDGPLTARGADVSVTINRNNSNRYPADIVLSVGIDRYLAGIVKNPSLIFAMGIVNTRSLGTIRLASKHYTDPPLIDPQIYSAEEDMDLALWGIKEIFKYANTSILAKYKLKWDYNSAKSCNNFKIGSDKHLRCYISYKTSSFLHAAGTCRMGPNSKTNPTVIDSNLKVWGIKNLRIADASIMPRITRGGVNAPTIMLAEKAADLIKNDY